MELRREPILFAFAALVVGLCAWGLYDDWSHPLRRPQWNNRGLEVAPRRVPDLESLPIPPRGSVERDLYGEPRDTRPLPKLRVPSELAAPEPAPWAWCLPPPVPGPGPAHWHRFLRVPAVASVVDDGNVGGANGELLADPAGDPSPPGAPAAPQDVGSPAKEVLEKRYDLLVTHAGLEQWGRIENTNKYEIGPDDGIVFQQFNVRTNKTFGAPITYPRTEVLRYQLAKTLKNEYEQRVRKVSLLAGNESRIREMGLWCLARGDELPELFGHAERLLRKALDLAPDDPENSLALGRLLETTFRFEDAWKLYRGMTEGSFRADADAWVALASLEARLHLDRDAQAHLERAAQLEPANFRSKLALGEFFLARGEAGRARVLLEGAVRSEPQGLENAAWRTRIRTRLGEAALAGGDLDAAADAFGKARAVEADDDDAEATAGLASVAFLRRDLPAALALLDAQIERRPTAAALVTRGVLKTSQGAHADARRDFERAVGLDPVRDVRPLAGLAFLDLQAGRPVDAYAAIERALRNDPTDPYALMLQGRLLRDRGQLDQARAKLKEATLADLEFVDPLVELGLVGSEEGLVESADRYFAKAIEIDATNPEIHALRGLNLLEGGQVRRAREAFVAGLGVTREHSLSRLGVALCDYLDGDGKNAKLGLRAVADGKGPFADYALSTLQRIEIHDLKQEWNDSFDRSALRLDWKTEHVVDVRSSVLNGEARLQGVFEVGGEARVRREDIAANQFRSFTVDVRVPSGDPQAPANQADVVVFVRREELRQGQTTVTFEVAVVRERSGLVKLRYKLAEDAPPARELAIAWPEGRPVRVTIGRDDQESQPRGFLSVDGVVVATDLKFPRGAAGNFVLGISVASDSGRTASVSFDDVRIVTKRTE